MLGQGVTMRKVRNQIVIKDKAPQRVGLEGKDNSKLEAAQARFQEALQYGRLVNSAPDVKALYMAGLTAKKRNAFLVAVSDFLNAPVSQILNPHFYRGAVGDVVTVKATDDFMVTRVFVEILGPGDVVIESGDASLDPTRVNQWVYKATVANATLAGTKLRATAYDRPGNEGVSEVML